MCGIEGHNALQEFLDSVLFLSRDRAGAFKAVLLLKSLVSVIAIKEVSEDGLYLSGEGVFKHA